MSLVDPVDTFAYQQSRIFTSHRNMERISCGSVSLKIHEFTQHHANAKILPETSALDFYSMNHGVALLRAEYAELEPLRMEDCKYVQAYHSRMGLEAVRAFYYLILICTREARHNKLVGFDAPAIQKAFGDSIADFFSQCIRWRRGHS